MWFLLALLFWQGPSKEAEPVKEEANKGDKRVELNLLGKTDTAAGESGGTRTSSSTWWTTTPSKS
jgi:hypothetical protein